MEEEEEAALVASPCLSKEASEQASMNYLKSGVSCRNYPSKSQIGTRAASCT
jgi:hypothetical protein